MRKVENHERDKIKDSHHRYPIIVIVSFEARKIVIRIFGSVGDAPHTIHEEVLRKVDCPALNVWARCAPSSSACTCVTRERERTLLLSFSLLFIFLQVCAKYPRCHILPMPLFSHQKSGERGERVKVPGCRAATVRARTVRANALKLKVDENYIHNRVLDDISFQE